jgi:hypothetical protein
MSPQIFPPPPPPDPPPSAIVGVLMMAIAIVGLVVALAVSVSP